MLEVPLDSLRLCVNKASTKIFAILQMSLSLLFGEHSAALSNLPTPRIKLPFRSLRHHSFCGRPRTNTVHQIDAPRDERVEYSRHVHQGRTDILRRDIYVPPLGLDHFRRGKGGVLCTSTRV